VGQPDTPLSIFVKTQREEDEPSIMKRSSSFHGRLILGRYRVNTKLAQGGMSTVYIARDTWEGKLYAVKVLRKDLASDPQIRDRFINESKAIQRVKHPSVVRVVDIGKTDDGRICLVTEYIHGSSLRNHMKKGPLEVTTVVPIICTIAEGLALVHNNSVVHRDLKPENILLPFDKKNNGLAKLIDFGIARIIDTPRITTNQHVMGTPEYIAPEQATDQAIDGRTDIYSLGVIMYEMLTGKLPFGGADSHTLLRKHVSEPPPPLHDYPGADLIPRGLQHLVLHCLAKTRRNRPANMDALVSILENFG
jgi:serine/threonine-protein kinase